MKKIISFYMTIAVAIGCTNQERSQADELSSKLFASSDFKNFGVDRSSLGNPQISYTSSGKTAVVIPFKDQITLRNMIGYFDSNSKYISSQIVQINSDDKMIDNKILEQEFKANKFNGSFVFTTQSGLVNFSFINSTVVKAGISARITSCSSVDDVGNCAGRAITGMGPISKALCYMDFIPCLAVQVGDCLLTGCPMK